MSSTVPPTPDDDSTTEYLTQDSGSPAPPSAGSAGGRRGLLVAGGVVGALALAGAGYGVYWLTNAGPQPAEALPAETLAYISMDIDPSGSQKIAALEFLNKFPAFKDEAEIDSQDDVRKWVFDKAQDEAQCANLNFEDDIEPWLGNDVAMAAVDTGEEDPAVVMVVGVTDQSDAEHGLEKLRNCAVGGDAGDASGDQTGGWAVSGDWAILAESDTVAQHVVDLAEEGTLADDDTYQKWTDQVGEPGVMTLYAAPAAGDDMLDFLESEGSNFFGDDPFVHEDTQTSQTFPSPPSMTDRPARPGHHPHRGPGTQSSAMFEDGIDERYGDPVGADVSPYGESSVVPDPTRRALEDFQGAAMTVRFNDGALEVEVASQNTVADWPSATTGTDVMATLPSDTTAALGVGFSDGWLRTYVDAMVDRLGMGEDVSTDDLFEQASQETGLNVPDDVETLAGNSLAISIGGDFNPEASFESGDSLPIGVKIQGDPAAIEKVLDKLRDQGLDDGGVLTSQTSGTMVALALTEDYRSELILDGGLGQTQTYREVMPAVPAQSALYVNFDAGDDWLTGLADGDPDVEENLRPLSALGASGWIDGDITHAVVRLTTD